jgi:hypothetical protein
MDSVHQSKVEIDCCVKLCDLIIVANPDPYINKLPPRVWSSSDQKTNIRFGRFWVRVPLMFLEGDKGKYFYKCFKTFKVFQS